jgi:hypothetical protein
MRSRAKLEFTRANPLRPSMRWRRSSTGRSSANWKLRADPEATQARPRSGGQARRWDGTILVPAVAERSIRSATELRSRFSELEAADRNEPRPPIRPVVQRGQYSARATLRLQKPFLRFNQEGDLFLEKAEALLLFLIDNAACSSGHLPNCIRNRRVIKRDWSAGVFGSAGGRPIVGNLPIGRPS